MGVIWRQMDEAILRQGDTERIARNPERKMNQFVVDVPLRDASRTGADHPLQHVSRSSSGTQMRSWIAILAHKVGGLFHHPWTPAVLVIAGIVGLAALLLGLLQGVDPAAVRQAMAQTPWTHIALSYFFSAVSYLTLIGYEVHAARASAPAKPVPFRTLALGAFTSYAIGHTLGLPIVTANAVRWRVYSPAGLTLADIGKLAAITGLTLWLGLVLAIGAGLLLEADPVATLDRLPVAVHVVTGAALLALLAGFVLWSGQGNRSIGRGIAQVRLPGGRSTLIQIGLGFLDVSAAAAALWILLPADSGVRFLSFSALFACAIIGAVLTHAPAGLGAFEAAMLVTLPNTPQVQVLSALVLWRVTYFLTPFVLAIALLCGRELQRPGSRLASWMWRARLFARSLAPSILAALTFAGGIVLLVSGATPSEGTRIHALKHLVPLPFVELSHLTGSAAGVLLLIIAWGLKRRLDSAWIAAVTVLAAGIVLSLAKGFDWEEALVLGAALSLLLMHRTSFYRKGGILAEPLSPGWLAAIAIVVVGSIWLGFLAYTNVDYSNELWWSFAWKGDASRFLRASVAAVVVMTAIALHKLVSHRPQRRKANLVNSEALAPVIASSDRAESSLAYLGDKEFLTHDAGDAFLMYGVRGKSWIALGDPVGNPDRTRDLLWRFIEVVDAHAGRPVFYQTSPRLLPLCLDAGLSLVKLGEEAKVDLSSFTVEGGAGRAWRQTLSRAKREDLDFSIIPAAELGPYLPDLKAVSDAWLTNKSVGEKGFSIGFWSDAYVSRFDHAVVRQAGEIVGFATIWYGQPGGEITVDLMRHRPSAHGVMDVLFINLMLEGKKRGYRWFNLGMAPLSGLSEHRLAPNWGKIAGFVLRHGERAYGFAGLKAYKEKFRPVWEPRYLAYPGSWAMPQVLLDVTSLISRGTAKTVWK
ncbi:bifunctional lysylphosphatidylglycerol flippase/synthetase MprF [Bradyrhizobium sp. SRL28]|uniref:bifunctional lysylphosphatidylglycerol flippase/synthetase MprF n=1 Tax=Bradyrhizobium sp. SRL28 TaxID=2836178 RepID=UPI001BDE4411|nr:bifunctional lysylphosphatidylglycerol flippase/synthetase MprF [Bradyrhizobium sp. SRL28]MBT1512860.1 bifunctional lysylphosphatidylglycerol flippase/synthetase MprF [Bradyrhizobium sp. SRL28]